MVTRLCYNMVYLGPNADTTSHLDLSYHNGASSTLDPSHYFTYHYLYISSEGTSIDRNHASIFEVLKD